MKKLRAGIVGCGGIANAKHLPAMEKCGLYEVVAFCDIIPEQAQETKEKFGSSDAKVFTDYRELVKEDLDVCDDTEQIAFRNFHRCHGGGQGCHVRKADGKNLCGNRENAGDGKADRASAEYRIPEQVSSGQRLPERNVQKRRDGRHLFCKGACAQKESGAYLGGIS